MWCAAATRAGELDRAEPTLDEGVDADQQCALTALRRNGICSLHTMSQHRRGEVQDHRAQPYGVLRPVHLRLGGQASQELREQHPEPGVPGYRHREQPVDLRPWQRQRGSRYAHGDRLHRAPVGQGPRLVRMRGVVQHQVPHLRYDLASALRHGPPPPQRHGQLVLIRIGPAHMHRRAQDLQRRKPQCRHVHRTGLQHPGHAVEVVGVLAVDHRRQIRPRDHLAPPVESLARRQLITAVYRFEHVTPRASDIVAVRPIGG